MGICYANHRKIIHPFYRPAIWRLSEARHPIAEFAPSVRGGRKLGTGLRERSIWTQNGQRRGMEGGVRLWWEGWGWLWGKRGCECSALPGLSCGSCGLQSTHDWEAEGVAGDPTLEPTTSLSLPPLPPALSVPLSSPYPPPGPYSGLLLFPWTPPPSQPSSGLCPPPREPQRILSTPRVNPIPPLLTHLPWLPSAPGLRPSPSAWHSTVTHQSPLSISPPTASP